MTCCDLHALLLALLFLLHRESGDFSILMKDIFTCQFKNGQQEHVKSDVNILKPGGHGTQIEPLAVGGIPAMVLSLRLH